MTSTSRESVGSLGREASEYDIHLVCGGREFRDRRHMEEYIGMAIRHSVRRGQELVVVHGGARGADRLAGTVATENAVKTVVFEADWDRLGKSAGFKRNVEMAGYLSEMARAGARVQVVAFPGGNGTDHMRETARSMGIPVFSPPPVKS
jgi:hypothetical protein